MIVSLRRVAIRIVQGCEFISEKVAQAVRVAQTVSEGKATEMEKLCVHQI